jgi:hypothetical protein
MSHSYVINTTSCVGLWKINRVYEKALFNYFSKIEFDYSNHFYTCGVMIYAIKRRFFCTNSV